MSNDTDDDNKNGNDVVERDIAFVRALAELLHEHDLEEIEVAREYGEDDEIEIRLTRAPRVAAASHAQPAHAMAPAQPAAPPSDAASAAAGPDLSDAITSPMVGTVYLSPEPGTQPFVAVGDQVAEGQTVLIIEAMKTMNQIPSPRAGTVKAILVGNAEPVEYGAPMMIVG